MKKVLLIDDEPVITTLYSKHLSFYGIEVKGINDPKKVIPVLEEGDYGLLLCDVMMPEVSGIDLIKMIRAHPKLGELPIVVLTARDEAKGKDEALQAGANDVVSKTAPFEEVLNKVTVYLKE